MTSFLFLAIALLAIGTPAFASTITPELDPTTLTAIVTGITGLAVAFRMAQRRNSK